MRVLIRADSDPTMGTGHVMRMLAMAHSVQRDGGTALLAAARIDAPIAARLRDAGIEIIEHALESGSDADVAWTAGVVADRRCDWLVTDGYDFRDDFQRSIHARGIPQLVVDDYGHCQHYCAELVLNQNSYAHEGFYGQREPGTELLLGPRYALLREEFQRLSPTPTAIADRARRVLVTMGGADPVNATALMIEALRRQPDAELEARVLVGGANPRAEELAAQCDDARIQLLRNVGDMPALMQWADLAIAGAGTTTWELAFMCVPTLLVILADNQRAVAESMGELGACVNLGWHHELEAKELAATVERVAADRGLRLRMAKRGHELVDGRGGQRVLERMAARAAGQH